MSDLVRLYDVTAPAHPQRLGEARGHADRVYSMSFAPDGRTLATAGIDRTAQLWDVTNLGSPALSAVLTGHEDRVYSVAFSPDGQVLSTGSEDDTARLWEVDPSRVASRVCAKAHPVITPQEWQKYFPDMEFQPPCR